MELLRRRRARRSLLDFTRYTKPDYSVNWHHEAICRALDRFFEGEIKRLILCAPPRYGKSELFSRRFPAYILGRDPDAQVIACSYGADLASSMNRDVQRIIDTPEYHRLFPETLLNESNVRNIATENYLRNSDLFEIVGHRGAYRSAGVGGGITGRGGNYVLIDDPIKNREEANSAAYRDRLWDWYTSTLYTRLEKDAGILLGLTRWHEDDLAGRLLRQAENDPAADQWTVVSFKAVAETVDEDDPRVPGEPLWPEKFSLESLEKTRAVVGAYDWSALYQQRPAPIAGARVRRDWLHYADPPLAGLEIGMGVDLAISTKDTADYSACAVIGRDKDGRLYVLDVQRARLPFNQVVGFIRAMAEKWRPRSIGVEVVQFQAAVVQELLRTTNLPVFGVRPDRDKLTRFQPLEARYEQGMVFHAHGLPAAFEDELLSFPLGQHDDMVDAAVYAYGQLGSSVAGGADLASLTGPPTAARELARRTAGYDDVGPDSYREMDI